MEMNYEGLSCIVNCDTFGRWKAFELCVQVRQQNSRDFAIDVSLRTEQLMAQVEKDPFHYYGMQLNQKHDIGL